MPTESNYPDRKSVPNWARYACMAFGLANMVSAFLLLIGRGPWMGPPDAQFDHFMGPGGLLVGAAWLGFGWYGGLPLFETVPNWVAASAPDATTDAHLGGLRVLRRRRWMMFGLIPLFFVLAPLGGMAMQATGEPGMALLIVAAPTFTIAVHYVLSRCPRCGYGFNALSKTRAAGLMLTSTCRNCGLSLGALRK